MIIVLARISYIQTISINNGGVITP